MVKDPATLVGLAIGDSLGMPFETMRSDNPILLNWDGSYLPSEYHKLKPGQWTDDTMMAKLLMESLFICGGFYPKDVADRYLHWYISGDTRGMGKTTTKSLSRLHEGEWWTRSGIDGAEGNGTAMRVAPMGAFYNEDTLTAAEFARVEAQITHKSQEACEGSAAVASMISLIWQGVEKERLLRETIRFIQESKVKSFLFTLDAVRNNIPLDQIIVQFGTKAHVVQTVPSAMAIFLKTDSYEEAITTAIRFGGDTDTTAAIAGALAGTYYGFGGIPDKYKTQLEKVDHLHKLDTKIGLGPNTSVMWKL